VLVVYDHVGALVHQLARRIKLLTNVVSHVLGLHYVRKANSTCARTKNGDAQIVHLRRRVSHYRVIGDARLGVSPISIHGRHAMSERVTYLISSWDPYATNPRRVLRVHISYF
jgi:hypothetical protein